MEKIVKTFTVRGMTVTIIETVYWAGGSRMMASEYRYIRSDGISELGFTRQRDAEQAARLR